MTTDPNALTDGHWAPDHHGIQRWMPDPNVMHPAVWRQLELDLEAAS